MRTTGRWSALVMAAGLVLVLASATAARDSAIQCTPDGSGILVNKPVGDEDWVITYRTSDGFTTGNVLNSAGEVTFLACNRTNVAQGMLDFRCSVSDGCSDTECPGFTSIPEPVALPCSFFASPCRKNPTNNNISVTCQTRPPEPPNDTEASCVSFAQRYGCYDYTFSVGSCAVENCCTVPICSEP